MAARHFRAHQRFAVRLPVTVTVTAPGRSVVAKGTTVDLGIGGGACELDTPLRLGDAVHMLIEGPHPIATPGEVAWIGWAESSAVRLGVRFRSEDAYQIALLLEALGVSADVGT